MSEIHLVCWKCGASVAEHPLPLSRYAECAACRAELHVCRMCRWYDPAVAHACREPIAEEVKDKGRANFCGYFQPRPDAYGGDATTRTRSAGRRLADLFGEPAPDEPAGEPLTEAEAAQRRLEALLRGGK